MDDMFSQFYFQNENKIRTSKISFVYRSFYSVVLKSEFYELLICKYKLNPRCSKCRLYKSLVNSCLNESNDWQKNEKDNVIFTVYCN